MGFLPVIIDLALIIILISSIFDGRRKGFVKMILSIIATILSISIANEFAEPVAVWINQAFVHDRIAGSIENAISSSISGGTQAIKDALPDYIVRAAEAGGVSADGLLAGIGSSANAAELAENICIAAENAFINGALVVVAFCIVFAISSIVLSFGISAINRIFKLPILRTLNKTLGGVLGGVKGAVIMFIVSGLIGLAAVVASTPEFVEAVEQTVIQQEIWSTIISFFK